MADPDVFVHLVDFKMTSVDEMVRENEDGTFTILINSRSAPNRQKEAYEHAMEHIRSGDFEQEDLDVQQIEKIRHGIENAIDKPIPAADWEKYMRRVERARKRNTRITGKTIGRYLEVRAEMSDFFEAAEDRWLEE